VGHLAHQDHREQVVQMVQVEHQVHQEQVVRQEQVEVQVVLAEVVVVVHQVQVEQAGRQLPSF
jgi:hypothetical protein